MSVGELPIETFLKAQPRSTLIRLYEKPASCLAVFRCVRLADTCVQLVTDGCATDYHEYGLS